MNPTAPFDWNGKPSWTTGDIFVSPNKGTTMHAWEAWDFTRDILFLMQHTDFDEEHAEWRMYWFSGVVALRAVGHVLRKVDSQKSEGHRHAIGDFWTRLNASKDANWIFFDFIERERNNILKEFSFGASLPSEEDGRLLAYNGTHLDGTELYREAVYWWRGQLRYLELAVAG